MKAGEGSGMLNIEELGKACGTKSMLARAVADAPTKGFGVICAVWRAKFSEPRETNRPGEAFSLSDKHLA
jgi:hypothetical protein